jgi:hypothetical protein
MTIFYSNNPSSTGSKARAAGEKLPRSVILRGQRMFQHVRNSGRKIKLGDMLVFFYQEPKIGSR